MSKEPISQSSSKNSYLTPIKNPTFSIKRRLFSHSHSVSINLFRPKTVATRAKSISSVKLQDLQSSLGSLLTRFYAAKCADQGIQVIPAQVVRFLEAATTHFTEKKCILKDMELGAKSAKAVGHILLHHPEFFHYDLSKNNLGDSGVYAISKVLCKSRSIVHLDLSNNDVSPGGAAVLLSKLKKQTSLVSLDLASNEGYNRNRLGVHGSAKLSELLRMNRILTHINIAKTAIGNEGAASIAKGIEGNYTVLSLNLSSNRIGPSGLGDLCRAISDSSLEELVISSNSIGNEGCGPLGNLLLGEYGGPCLLKSLDLSKNNISSDGESKLFFGMAMNTVLQRLKLDGNDFSAGLSPYFSQCMKENQVLRELSLNFCSLGDSEVFKLYEGLWLNRGLTILLLRHNKILDNGAIYLANSLRVNRSLRELDLSENEIKVKITQNKGGLALASGLTANASLETLNLRGNNLRNPVAELFIEVTRKNASLTSVNLHLNSIDQRLIIEIQDNLSNNQKLKTRSLVPILKTQIEQLQLDPDHIEALQCKIQRIKEEKNRMAKRIGLKSLKFADVKSAEEKKTAGIYRKRRESREHLLLLCNTYNSLQTELILIKKASQRELNEMSGKIAGTEHELLRIQQQRTSKEESVEISRVEAHEHIAKLKQQLHKEQLVLKCARKDLLAASAKLKSLAGTKFLRKSSPYVFLASEKLAIVKRKQLRNDFAKSRSGTLMSNF